MSECREEKEAGIEMTATVPNISPLPNDPEGGFTPPGRGVRLSSPVRTERRRLEHRQLVARLGFFFSSCFVELLEYSVRSPDKVSPGVSGNRSPSLNRARLDKLDMYKVGRKGRVAVEARTDHRPQMARNSEFLPGTPELL